MTTGHWYDDPERIERMREQDIELRLLHCPAWRSIITEYRRAYDTPAPQLVQPTHVLAWAHDMIQRALRLGPGPRTDLPQLHQTSVTDPEQRALDNIPDVDESA